MITARDVMKTQLVTVTQETPISEAIALLLQHRISGLPVVDGDFNLVGILTEKDLLRVCYEAQGSFQKVGDLMSCDVRTFQLDAPLEDVCDCLMTNHFRRVPILDGEKLAGLVSRADLLPTIMEIVLSRAQ